MFFIVDVVIPSAWADSFASLMMDACEGNELSIYQSPNAAYLTDTLIERAEQLLREAQAVAEREEQRYRVEREMLSVRFLRLAREPVETVAHRERVDAFFADVKRFGITEIRERRSLAISRKNLLEHRYAEGEDGYNLYYIMQ